MDKVKIKVYEHSYEFIKYLISNHIYYESLESFKSKIAFAWASSI